MFSVPKQHSSAKYYALECSISKGGQDQQFWNSYEGLEIINPVLCILSTWADLAALPDLCIMKTLYAARGW